MKYDLDLMCSRLEDVLDWLIYTADDYKDSDITTCLESGRNHLLRASNCFMRARDLQHKRYGSD